ncbi:MAG: two-component system histidine kinase PnpS [Vulcanibacillus sp.]
MKKIKHKIILIYVLIIFVFTLILGIYISYLIKETYIGATEDRLYEESIMIENYLFNTGYLSNNNQDIEKLIREFSLDLTTRITIIDSQGIVLADSVYDKNMMDNHLNRPEVILALKGETGIDIRYSDTLGINMLYTSRVVTDDDKNIEVLRLAISLQEIQEEINAFWLKLILALLVVFIITIVISTKLTSRITKPIEDVTELAQDIMHKDYSKRLEVDRNDEIGQLSEAINNMADGLKNQMSVIEKNENRLSAILNNMASGVILIDNDGKIIYINPAVEQLIGEFTYDKIGNYYYEVCSNEINDLIKSSLRTNESIHTEIKVYNPTKKYLDCNIIPILDYLKQTNNILIVFVDITKIRHLERMRTEFVANVSHELRTPITSLKGFTETLLDGALKDEETTREFLEIIYKESDRLQRLVLDLLDLSRIEQNEDIFNFKIVNLENVIESSITTMMPQIEKRNLEVIKELSTVFSEVDEDRIRQVILNLISNAVAYTPEKGLIYIRLEDLDNEKVKIEIEDTGIGIPKKSISRIFERFYRVDKARSRESGGTGLGLAIVKHIIESHYGIIEIDSKVGKGTTFTIILPKKRVL